MAGGPLWTPIELQKLRLIAGQVSVTEAVSYFKDRSRTAVIQKAYELDLLWRDRRRFVSAQDAARTLGIGASRLLALARRVGVTDTRYGVGARTPHVFRPGDIDRIATALADEMPDHPDFEMYRCRSCGGETFKPWRWRYRADAYRCGHEPMCHRCRVHARTRPRGEVSVMLSRTTRRARRSVQEIERLAQRVGT